MQSKPARHPNSERISAFLATLIRLDRALDEFHHRDTLVKGERTHPFMKFRAHLEVELPALGAAMGKSSTVCSGQRPRFASPSSGNGGRGIAFPEPGQNGHV